jgi:hypothetical protein
MANLDINQNNKQKQQHKSYVLRLRFEKEGSCRSKGNLVLRLHSGRAPVNVFLA